MVAIVTPFEKIIIKYYRLLIHPVSSDLVGVVSRRAGNILVDVSMEWWISFSPRVLYVWC
jgi:hypothetical protein